MGRGGESQTEGGRDRAGVSQCCRPQGERGRGPRGREVRSWALAPEGCLFLPRAALPRRAAPCLHRAQRPPVPEPRRLMGRNGGSSRSSTLGRTPETAAGSQGRRGLGPGALFTSQSKLRPPLLEEGGAASLPLGL